MSELKLRKKIEKLKQLETIIQNFEKDKSKYEHLENEKYNRFNKKFIESVKSAENLKDQGDIQLAIKKYKEALDWVGGIIDQHKHLESKTTNTRYYKRRNILWLITAILLIAAFVILPFGATFNITVIISVIFIALMVVATLVVCNAFRSKEE
jgi:hypothetical protein